MTLLTVGRRRADAGTVYPLPLSATAAPWNSSDVPCVIPTYDGVGATIHPSVVDMGAKWNGYRWWMANTPYANMAEPLENPCIWASNDRRTWTVPAGLTNPIDPDPGNPWFHSDTELVWDPEAERMVVFYRLASAATSPATIYLRAQSSADGVTWTDHGTLFQFPGAGARLSPAIQRVGPGEWRMWTWGNTVAAHHWSATNPLGPWTDEGECTAGGSPWLGWHGDVIHAGGAWRSAYTVDGNVRLVSSSDGVAWSAPTTIATGGAGGGWDDRIYRPTLLPSTAAGFLDCWYSGYGSVPGGCATDYVRLPLSLWPTPPPLPPPAGSLLEFVEDFNITPANLRLASDPRWAALIAAHVMVVNDDPTHGDYATVTSSSTLIAVQVDPVAVPFPPDQWVEADVALLNSGANTARVIVYTRATGNGDYYYGELDKDGAWKLASVVAGVDTNLASGSVALPAYPYTLRLEAEGSQITLLVNGTELATVANPDHATGQPGLGFYRAYNVCTEFRAGELP